MLIMTKSVLASMISFLLTIVLSLILIPILKKFKIDQVLSVYLERTHGSKKCTPTMGGLIFVLSTLITIILLLLLDKINLTYNFLIIIWVFVSYSIIGFIDDYLIIKRSSNKGLSENQKFIMQIFVAIIFFYLFMVSGNEPLLWVHALNIKYDIGFLYGILILFVLVASSNAVNLTDGLDGLATGLSIIAYFTFGLIAWNTGWLLGYSEIAIFCFIMVGSLLAFLVFNSHPAKIFMGDTGSLSLGATLGSIAILTRHELLLVIIGIVFVIETLSVILQVSYFKITHGKRLFKMAPIHHGLEKMGYKETDIVKFFWIIGLIGSMIAIGFGIWI